jgi:hypothetical protein
LYIDGGNDSYIEETAANTLKIYTGGAERMSVAVAGVAIAGTLGVTGVITADAGIDVDNFNLDGTTLALSSGNMTIESAGEMILKQGGGIVRVYAGSTQVGALTTSSDNFGLKSFVSDKDIYIIGNDGGSTITACTFDMSDAGRVYFNSDIGISDSKVLRIGSDSDLQLYHDNTHGYIANGTGSLFIEADQFYFRNSGRTEYYASFITNGAVNLYHDNSNKLQTVSGGINVTGSISAGSAGTSSANLPALKVTATNTTDTGAAIAIQQAHTEGDTILFADYEPHVEWGISCDNSVDQVHFTAGASTNNLGSKTFYNNAGNARTAYIKHAFTLGNGNASFGGDVGIGTASPSNKLTVIGGNIMTDATSRRIGYWEADNVHDGYLVPYNGSGEVEIVSSYTSGAVVFKTGTSKTERMRIKSNGLTKFQPAVQIGIKQRNVSTWQTEFNVMGSTATNWDMTAYDEGGSGNSFLVIATWAHYAAAAHSLALVALVHTRGTAIYQHTILNHTDAYTGAFTISKASASTLRISKSAGTYGGTGQGFISVTGYNTT